MSEGRPQNRRRAYESALFAFVGVVIAAAALLTWRNIGADREATREAATRMTDAMAQVIENHFVATLRDAANAAESASRLVEAAGGPASFGSERALHAELRRELLDNTSAARLVYVDARGRALASSAEYPLATREVGKPLHEWTIVTGAGSPFRIGAPERSIFDGEVMFPFACDVRARDGSVIGTVRAEMRLSYFGRAWGAIEGLQRHSVLVGTLDGTVLMRVPLVGDLLRGYSPDLASFINTYAHGNKGNAEFTPQRDGITRYYSWRRMATKPLLIAIGVEKESVLAPWSQRSRGRVALLGAAAAGFLLFAALLVRHLRRLELSETAQREAEARYLAAVHSSSIGVVVMDPERNWVEVNPAIEEMTGYTRAELLALPPGILTLPEGHHEREQRFAALAEGRGSISFETSVRRKDGGQIWVHVSGSAMRSEGGEVQNYMIHVQDITDRKRVESELVDLNLSLERRVEERTADLKRANQDLEAFSYSAAHDIRSPLVTIGGFVDILARELGEVPEKAARRIDTIRRQVRHMTQTVDDLLALSRSSHTPLRKGPVDLHALAEETIDRLEPQAAGRDVKWIVHPMPEVWGDPGSLREALANILGNALKYTRGRETAVIEIGCSATDGGEAEFYVRDNGTGFDEAKASQLFKPFARLHSAAEFEGAGIGLAIVHRIIERNDGHIRAESPAGGGAVFRFTLPLRAEVIKPI